MWQGLCQSVYCITVVVYVVVAVIEIIVVMMVMIAVVIIVIQGSKPVIGWIYSPHFYSKKCEKL